ADSVRVGRAVLAEFNQPCLIVVPGGRLHVGMIPGAAVLRIAVLLQKLLQAIVEPALVRLRKILCQWFSLLAVVAAAELSRSFGRVPLSVAGAVSAPGP